MGLAAHIEALTGPLPAVRYSWDKETEILAGTLEGVDPGRGLTGSVELEGRDGSFIVLDVDAGTLRGLEIVVWPDLKEVATLDPPTVAGDGSLAIPSHVSQPGIEAVELDTRLAAERSADGGAIRVRVGNRRKVTATRLADGLIVELDRKGEIAGFWLMGVPHFDVPERAE